MIARLGRAIIVLSYSLAEEIGGDPEIVGKKLILHGYPLRVVGIAREGFSGLGEYAQGFLVADEPVRPTLGRA